MRPKARYFIEVAGVRYELVRHRARGARGLAWSAYPEGEDQPHRFWQTRTRADMETLLMTGRPGPL